MLLPQVKAQSESTRKIQISYFFHTTSEVANIEARRRPGTLCSAAEEYCSSGEETRVPARPPCSYGVSASPTQRRAAEACGVRRAAAGLPGSPGCRKNEGSVLRAAGDSCRAWGPPLLSPGGVNRVPAGEGGSPARPRTRPAGRVTAGRLGAGCSSVASAVPRSFPSNAKDLNWPVQRMTDGAVINACKRQGRSGPPRVLAAGISGDASGG